MKSAWTPPHTWMSDSALDRASRQVAATLVTAILTNFSMTPDIFLDRLRKSGPAPAYLFLWA